MNEAVVHNAVCRVVLRFRAWCFVDIGIGLPLVILEKRVADGVRIAHKAHAACSGAVNMGAAHGEAAVVVADKDRTAANLVEGAVRDGAVLGAGERDAGDDVSIPSGTCSFSS